MYGQTGSEQRQWRWGRGGSGGADHGGTFAEACSGSFDQRSLPHSSQPGPAPKSFRRNGAEVTAAFSAASAANATAANTNTTTPPRPVAAAIAAAASVDPASGRLPSCCSCLCCSRRPGRRRWSPQHRPLLQQCTPLSRKASLEEGQAKRQRNLF